MEAIILKTPCEQAIQAGRAEKTGRQGRRRSTALTEMYEGIHPIWRVNVIMMIMRYCDAVLL